MIVRLMSRVMIGLCIAIGVCDATGRDTLYIEPFTRSALASGWGEAESNGRRINHDSGRVIFPSCSTSQFIVRRFDCSAAQDIAMVLTLADGGSMEGPEYFAVWLDSGDGGGFREVFRDWTTIDAPRSDPVPLGVDGARDVVFRISGVSNAEVYYLDEFELTGTGRIATVTNAVVIDDPLDTIGEWVESDGGIIVTNGYVQFGRGQHITRRVDTSGFDHVTVNVRNVGQGGFEGGDDLRVLADVGDTMGFQIVGADVARGTNLVDSGHMVLPTGADDNPDLRIRIEAVTNVEWYRVHHVEVHGLPRWPPIPRGTVLVIQ